MLSPKRSDKAREGWPYTWTRNRAGSTGKRGGLRGDGEKEGHSPKCSDKITAVTAQAQPGRSGRENMTKRRGQEREVLTW